MRSGPWPNARERCTARLRRGRKQEKSQGSRRCRPAEPGGALGRALRRLVLRHLPRLGRYGAAPQAFPVLGGTFDLREIAMPESGLDQAADLTVASPYWNPRPVERGAVRALLDDAWHGHRPN